MKLILLSLQFALYILIPTTLHSKSNSQSCPESFIEFWGQFRRSVEKDRMKDLIFLTEFPLELSGADGKHKEEIGPKAFQGIIYKIFSEKCDIMESKNQKQWILKHKELPSKSSFLTCSKKWVQFCNFDFTYSNEKWRLTKINTTQKALFKNK